jgi:CRP-like cAMP-binding protein
MALVDDGTRSASILAAGNGATVYGIPNRDFTDLCQNNTAIGYVMMRNIAQDLSFKLRHRDAGPSSNQ